jgi:hydroxymethylbilane synthase
MIRVGTRESKLALYQTNSVLAKLKHSFPEHEFVTVPIKVHAEKDMKKPLFAFDTRGVFVKELEEALLKKEVDLVVHSLKDLPTDMIEGLTLAAVLDREDPRDVLISHNKTSFLQLPKGATVASSSRRRLAQLRALRPDLVFTDIRGNIDTRLKKHAAGECDAMVLAAAGLIRLKLDNHITEYFDTSVSLPAAGQAAIAVECRADDQSVLSMCKAIEDASVRGEITAERAFLNELGGGCSVPVGVLARSKDGIIDLTGCVAALDGSRVLRKSLTGPVANAQSMGIELAEALLQMGAEKILSQLKSTTPSVSPP